MIVATAGNSLIKPAMDATRPGGRIMLFAQTQRSEVAIDPAAVCVDEKTLMGSYSASVDLQDENVRLVFSIATKYAAGSDMELLDLIQEGNIGLIHAVALPKNSILPKK